MPQPKKKLSATRSGNRRSHLALKAVTAKLCAACQTPTLPHMVCAACGTYHGKVVAPQKVAQPKN